ncbi:acyl--CoA ligase [Streptomyces sp. A3M-1-3]|uniref:class I adenylate-forming enzyme family protein n=1 Tax=Streptomyces sp. A3M-1-3 TaxID=2962044 RepID=UPI0020B8D7E8|nr:class I adenylate-forming enzyme family protein [Streptomyces sp. A3M-1-3]MCP3821629.1 acyl--CoA ligase [Streptomyces sp. A3M-1-3]
MEQVRADRRAMAVIDGRAPATAEDAGPAAVAAARVLRAHGVRPGDRVLVKADNSVEQVVAVLALVHLGASLVLLDNHHTDAETLRALTAAQVRFVLTDRRSRPVPAGIRGLTVEELYRAAREPAGPDTGTGTGTGTDPRTNPESDPDTSEDFSTQAWYCRDDALVIWSSGTTGESKGIVKSGRAFLDNLERTRRLMAYGVGDVFLPLLPFSHQYGISLILLAHLSGGDLVVVPYTRLDRALAAGARCGATVVDATPATYRSALNLMNRRPALLTALRGVRMWCTGGAPMDRNLGRHFRESTGRPLLDGYGSTEAGNVAFATPDNPVGCGRILDGLEVRILSPDGRRALPPGEVGEIWLHTPDLMEGYLSAGGGIAPAPASHGYRTGDLGHLDEGGNLHVAGRRSAVHRLGHTLYPEVLERKAEVCGRPVKVIALADERRGHELVFVIEDPESGHPRVWRERVSRQLASFEHPNHVLVTDRFPLNRNGKTDVLRLRAWVTARLRSGPEQQSRQPVPAPAALD